MSILSPFLAAVCLWQGAAAPQASDYTGPKKRIAVSGFDLAIRELRVYSDYTPSGIPGHSSLDIDAPSEFGEGLGDMLVTALIDSKHFVVLERRDFKDVTTE